MTNPNIYETRRTAGTFTLTPQSYDDAPRTADVFTTRELAAVADALTKDRWRVTRYELTGVDGHEPELAHLEAYRSIIGYDLSTGGPDKVAATIATELPAIRLTGVCATKTYRQTEHRVIIRASGQVITDGPEHITELLANVCAS